MEGDKNNSSYSDMQEDLGDEGKADGVDTISRHTFTKKRQPEAMSELSYHQPNQLSQQDHAPSYPQESIIIIIIQTVNLLCFLTMMLPRPFLGSLLMLLFTVVMIYCHWRADRLKQR